MGRIIAGIGTSHVPSIGAAYDRGKQATPAWRPLFDAYVPVREWLQEIKPDVAIMVYNDHGADFSSTSTRPSPWARPTATTSPTKASACVRCRP